MPIVKDLVRLVLTLKQSGRSTEKAVKDVTEAYMLSSEDAEKLRLIINKKEDN